MNEILLLCRLHFTVPFILIDFRDPALRPHLPKPKTGFPSLFVGVNIALKPLPEPLIWNAPMKVDV